VTTIAMDLFSALRIVRLGMQNGNIETAKDILDEILAQEDKFREFTKKRGEE
jgi:hypothetical protein